MPVHFSYWTIVHSAFSRIILHFFRGFYHFPERGKRWLYFSDSRTCHCMRIIAEISLGDILRNLTASLREGSAFCHCIRHCSNAYTFTCVRIVRMRSGEPRVRKQALARHLFDGHISTHSVYGTPACLL